MNNFGKAQRRATDSNATLPLSLEEGYSAYHAGRYGEALLAFRLGAREAEAQGDRRGWFVGVVLSGLSAKNLRDFPLALRLLIEARAGEPPDRSDYYAFMARDTSFLVTLCYRPKLAPLAEGLRDLQAMAGDSPTSPACVEYLMGRLAFEQGHFGKALECFERTWQFSESGYIKENIAEGAIASCLALTDDRGVQQWIAVLDGIDSPFVALRKTMAAGLRVSLALLRVTGFPQLREAYRAFQDAEAAIDDPEWRERQLSAHLRVELLDPDGGDPIVRIHPARQVLLRRVGSRWHVHLRFERRLAFLDYRLAALRWAAGVAPVDDLFYTKPQQVPARVVPVVARDDLDQRLRKARAAVGWAHAYAKELDGWLECDWRQKKVQARCERIEEIARALQGGERSSGKEVA